MCGYLGAIDFTQSISSRLEALKEGLSAIRHRGPDGTKEHIGENYYLGQNRLSIIDLSSIADQPMISSDGKVGIVFNGEIYNYSELKGKLTDVRFKTSSDTEVILEGFMRHGTDFFKQLRGIFTIAIVDNRGKQKVILLRDPSGIKPLYICGKGGFSIFGSEIKALLPALKGMLSTNENVLKCYLNLGYCPEPNTIYKEIEAVRPGELIELTNEERSVRSLIEYDFEFVNTHKFDENKSRTRELLKTAVKRNLVADVEVAVALSGGIDSSLIYAFAHESESTIKGLTISFSDKEHDESETAQLYANSVGGILQRIEADTSLNLDTLNMILKNFDQPYADSSAINVYFLTRASGKITKVLLGGDGGDELYNGYPSQTWLTYLEKLGRTGIAYNLSRTMLKAASMAGGSSVKRITSRMLDLWSDKPREMLYDWHSWFPRKTMFDGKSPFLFDTSTGLRIYESAFDNEAPEEFKNFVVFDYFRKTMLSDYLRKTDMMSMLNGVEYRVPFLDEDLTSFALSIPFDQKSGLRESKRILRSIHKDIYPPQTSKGAKKGFTIPLDKALSKEEYSVIKENLLARESLSLEYVKKEYVEFLFRMLGERAGAEQEISRAGVYQRILMLYSLNLWNGGQ
jgi:asparagine synthase (glutamine-hydrolysing)